MVAVGWSGWYDPNGYWERPDPDQPWEWPETSFIAPGKAYFRCSACATTVTIDVVGASFEGVLRCPNEAAHGVSQN
jgi:hypothetical protein